MLKLLWRECLKFDINILKNMIQNDKNILFGYLFGSYSLNSARD